MYLDRNVRVPGVNVPEPNWANGCARAGWRVPRASTWCAAWAPPLKRTTAWTGRSDALPAARAASAARAQSQSTIVPLPASP